MPAARRMLYAGEILDADAARAAGLVDAIHQPERLLDAAVSLGERVAAQSWRALELTKAALRLRGCAGFSKIGRSAGGLEVSVRGADRGSPPLGTAPTRLPACPA